MRLLFPGKDERGDPELHASIDAEIAAAGGAISFARFMDLCLHHPVRGYYRRGRTRAGHGGDFLTSPEAHPAFAGAVARQLEVLGEVLETPAPVWVEAGAGTGTMANLVAESLPGARVIAVDTAAHVHRPEGRAPSRVRASGLPFSAGSVSGVYANELLDAFPVHRLRRAGGGWRAMFVSKEQDGFAWVEREAADGIAAEAELALSRGARVDDGGIVEVNPGMAPWLREASRVIGRGFVLLVDYGDDTPRLWDGSRPQGSLRCFAGHSVHDDPLRFPGTQDLTASVDFGAVAAAGRDAGFDAVAFLDQRMWLDGWGVGAAAEGLAERAAAGTLRRDEAEMNQHAVDYLRDPRGLGRLRVFCLAKGVRPTAIPGLAGEVPPGRRFSSETLPLTRLLDPFADLME